MSQDCTQASQNILCSGQTSTPDSMELNPFSFGCFSAQMTYFYSFHTGSNSSGEVEITVTPTDCNNALGNDPIYVTVYQAPTGINPCNPVGTPYQSGCASGVDEFTTILSGLQPNQDFILAVGSNHDTLYGPCNMQVSIAGSGVDVSASVDPLLVTLGQSATLSAEGGVPVLPDTSAAYSWSPQTWLDNAFSASTAVTPEATTSYTVSTQIGGCTVTDQITITVGPPIVIYSAFTPNGDGYNDVWNILGIERFENAQIYIYDRWGQNVFKSIGYNQPWDGTNRGKFLPTGTYYYQIQLNSLEVTIPPYSGYISLVH